MGIQSDENLVWHYTDSFGLKGIIETHTVWASALNELNDARELEEGRLRLLRAVESIRDQYDPAHIEEIRELLGSPESIAELAASTYSISASTNHDNLSLWRYYGGEASYAIGFDASKKLHAYTEPTVLQNIQQEKELITVAPDGREVYQHFPHLQVSDTEDWQSVSYDPSAEQEKSVVKALLKTNNGFNLGRVFFSAMKFVHFGSHKHQTFEAEEETRLIFRVTPEDAFTQFRSTSKGLRRHIRVAYREGGATHSTTIDGNTYEIYGCIIEHDKLPIKAIRLSPYGHREGAQHTLNAFLRANGYCDVEVSASDSPYIH